MTPLSDREKPPGWEGGFVPPDLPGLEKYVARALENFRKAPAKPGYQRVISKMNRGTIEIVTTTPNPRYVAARLFAAQVAIRNAHRWLEYHRNEPLPDWQSETDSVHDAERQLSSLLRFVRGSVAVASHSQADHVLGDGMKRDGSESAEGRSEEDFREAVSHLVNELDDYVDTFIP